jgi:tetraacyldisaccharide 4'-kinase
MLSLNTLWYGRSRVRWLLWPLSCLYRFSVFFHKSCYALGLKKTTGFPVKIIVVGNITVGGTGKSPLTAHLANWLTSCGAKVGLVSRGYGGKSKCWPCVVTADSDPKMVGDEAVMLVQQTACPMVVAPNRVQAVKTLLAENDLDVIISDDGLQHYALDRDIEIALVDSKRGLGNGMLLPAGPLRESSSRLNHVDFILYNGVDSKSNYAMNLMVGSIYNIFTKEVVDISYFNDKRIIAMAGIGNPDRFFSTLDDLGLQFERKVFPDHYHYDAADLIFPAGSCVIMTTKDSIKCCRLDAGNHFFCLPVVAQTSDEFRSTLWKQLN